MSKALLQQHAAKTLREYAEQQQNIEHRVQQQQRHHQEQRAQQQQYHQEQRAQQTRNDHAIAQVNTDNRSLKAEIDKLRLDLQNHGHEAQDVLPPYEDLHVPCAGVVDIK